MKTIKITEQLAQEILNYLALKPYREVYKLIATLQKQADECDQKPPEKPTPTENQPTH